MGAERDGAQVWLLLLHGVVHGVQVEAAPRAPVRGVARGGVEDRARRAGGHLRHGKGGSTSEGVPLNNKKEGLANKMKKYVFSNN